MMGMEETIWGGRGEKVEEEEEGRGKVRRTLLILVQRLSDRIRFPAERQEFTVVRHVQDISGVSTASYNSGYLLRGSKEAGTCSWPFFHCIWSSLSAAINIHLQRALFQSRAHLTSCLVDNIFSTDVRFVTFVIKMNEMRERGASTRPLLKYHFQCKM
jgi:hypothetical protein